MVSYQSHKTNFKNGSGKMKKKGHMKLIFTNIVKFAKTVVGAYFAISEALTKRLVQLISDILSVCCC